MEDTKSKKIGRQKLSKKKSKNVVAEHKDQLERLKEKDPNFYQYLQEHDKELLEFEDEDINEEDCPDMDDADNRVDDETNGYDDIREDEEEGKSSKNAITTEMVESWCNLIRESGKLSAVRSILRAFRIACHYGDDAADDSTEKFRVMSSSVFNKIMVFVLTEMDGILRKLLALPASGGKKETMQELMSTRKWRNYSHLVKSYYGNCLHVLNQMTDTEMISFTLRRLKYSSIFLAALPTLLRKYIKVILHFWGTGGGALPIVSFLFLRDICIRLGTDCLDECLKGTYKAYVLNSQYVNATKLKHIQFLGNCVVELVGVDIRSAYQHAFVLIRQLAMILRDAISMKTKDAFRKVYEWKYINCLELWTAAVCAYSSEPDFMPLAYPLVQIISGVARLVPTARYFPLRLRCVKMLNRIAASTETFIPVSMLLLDMLEMKELNRPPAGGVGKSVDLRTILKVTKPTLKTRAFQEACVFSVIEELAEHLAQWSYSVAFLELSFIPDVRLRSFCKATKIERFSKEMRQLIRQIEANAAFTNKMRVSTTYLPNDPAAASFLEDEKKMGTSPLSQHVFALRQRAQQRNNSLVESSVMVGEHSSISGKKKASKRNDDDDDDVDDDEDQGDDTNVEKGAAIFSSSWLPAGGSKTKSLEENEKKTKRSKKGEKLAVDEDVVEDLVISSDEEEDEAMSDDGFDEFVEDSKPAPPKHNKEKRKWVNKWSKNKDKSPGKNSNRNSEPASDRKQSKKRKFSTDKSKKNGKPTGFKKSKKNKGN